MSFNHPSIITWDYLEKYMTANPKSVLAFYILNRADFLDDEPITIDNRWEIDHKKFRQISSDIFGLVKFMIREDGMSNEEIRDRHSFLVDKKFLEGLTEKESNELAQINRLLDALEEKYYAPIMETLATIINEALATIRTSDNIPMPGLELDKLIAEKVLGWHQDSIILQWYQDGNITMPNRQWWYEDEDAVHLDHFSTDIKAAWGLVEKFKLCIVPIGDGWTATRLGQILVDGERNKAPTAPHAICLAALFYANKDGRSERDKKSKFYYDVNDEGIEYLIAHATIKDVGDDWILTKEWSHKLTRGDFFPDAKPGQRWNISYNGNSPWTGIKSAVKNVRRWTNKGRQ